MSFPEKPQPNRYDLLLRRTAKKARTHEARARRYKKQGKRLSAMREESLRDGEYTKSSKWMVKSGMLHMQELLDE